MNEESNCPLSLSPRPFSQFWIKPQSCRLKIKERQHIIACYPIQQIFFPFFKILIES